MPKRRMYLLVGSAALTLGAWALWFWGPVAGRDAFLGFAQVGTLGTLLLAVGVLLEARRR